MIPDALKLAICPTCNGHGDHPRPTRQRCPLCGGSGINPDMIMENGTGVGGGGGHFSLSLPSGRYVVIPLEDTQ